MVTEGESVRDAVVVGAGLAGLVAAAELLEAGRTTMAKRRFADTDTNAKGAKAVKNGQGGHR